MSAHNLTYSFPDFLLVSENIIRYPSDQSNQITEQFRPSNLSNLHFQLTPDHFIFIQQFLKKLWILTHLMPSFLISHDIKRKQHEKILLKYLIFCIIINFNRGHSVQMTFSIRKNHIHFQKIRRIATASQIQHTRTRKLHPIPPSLLPGKLNSSCKIILDHPYSHRRVIRTLTFYVINLISDQQPRIRNNLTIHPLILITQLHNLHISRIRCMKNIIDQRHDQKCHLLHHSTKNIIKNRIITQTILLLVSIIIPSNKHYRNLVYSFYKCF